MCALIQSSFPEVITIAGVVILAVALWILIRAGYLWLLAVGDRESVLYARRLAFKGLASIALVLILNAGIRFFCPLL